VNLGRPADLLPALLGAYQERFAGNRDAMIRHLIDDHPAGWPSLSELRTRPEGPDDAHGRCYCHTHGREPTLIDETTLGAGMIEPDFLYVLHPQGIEVIDLRDDDAFELATTVPWSTIPDQDFSVRPYDWNLGPATVLTPTTAFQAHQIAYAYCVEAGSRAEQILRHHGYQQTDPVDDSRAATADIPSVPRQILSPPAAVPPARAHPVYYQLPEGSSDAEARLTSSRTRFDITRHEPLLTVFESPIRRRAESEAAWHAPEQPGPRTLHGRQSEDAFTGDLRDGHLVTMARHVGRYGEVQLLCVYPATGQALTTYSEFPGGIGMQQHATVAQACAHEPFASTPRTPEAPVWLDRAAPGSSTAIRLDIARGHLRVHDRRRTADGTLTALATYTATGRGVHLTGDGDQRRIAARFDTAAQAHAAWPHPLLAAAYPTAQPDSADRNPAGNELRDFTPPPPPSSHALHPGPTGTRTAKRR